MLELAARLAQGPLHDLAPEILAGRRTLMLDTLANLRAGITLPRPLVAPRPYADRRAALAPKPRPVWHRYATDAERRAARKATAAKCKAQLRADIKAGLRPKLARTSQSPATLSLPVGAWIRVRTRTAEKVLQVLAVVPAQMAPPIPTGATVRNNGETGPVKLPRYMLAWPSMDALEAKIITLAGAAELERGVLEILPEPPEQDLGRLMTPLPVGARVYWTSQGGGASREAGGDILAYLPAGKSYLAAVKALGLGALKPPSGNNNADVSVRDRYLVRERRNLLIPAAHMVERVILANRKDAA
jgi:hypothetical protein